jgi:3D (Asp-Asp-Asp) domain-containing protein
VLGLVLFVKSVSTPLLRWSDGIRAVSRGAMVRVVLILLVASALWALPTPEPEVVNLDLRVEEMPIRRAAKSNSRAVVTAYTPECRGCSGVTASGVSARSLLARGIPSVAASSHWRMGSCVDLLLGGSWVRHRVVDRGGDIRGRGRFDLLVSTHAEAVEFGRRSVAYRPTSC